MLFLFYLFGCKLQNVLDVTLQTLRTMQPDPCNLLSHASKYLLYIYIYIYTGVTGGTDQTSGGCSLC